MGHLTWGLSRDKIKELFPDADLGNGVIGFKAGTAKYSTVDVRNFPGDCGALLIQGANQMTEKAVKEIVKYASLSGFSKIFATVVSDNAERAVAAFKKARFICVAKGKSNRNNYKDDYVFVKYIRNCEYKGY